MNNSLAVAYAMKRRKKMSSEGPMPEESDRGNRYDDMVDRIMSKRMSEGGRVANGGMDDTNDMADGRPNNFDDLALGDELESTNSGSADGDFLGNGQEDMDRHDIVAKIMRQRSMKQRNPRPA